MSKELKLILKSVPSGLEPTPRQSAQREKFAQAAKECKEHFAGSKLKGAASIKARNAFMSERLRQ
jgi:hypothetical protein